jgi:hypothetical protein
MPNWCDNNITITGSKSVIDKIEKIVREEEKSDIGFLQFMYPCPKELEDTTADGSKDKALMEKYGHSDWYNWKTDSWGTKWDVNEFYGVDRQGDTISFGFSSAWAPPLGAFEHFLSAQAITSQTMSSGMMDWALNWTRCSTSRRAWRSMKQNRKKRTRKMSRST